jgi:NRPS condensation-like uncharacterized protein
MPSFLKNKKEVRLPTLGKQYAASAMDKMNYIARQIGDQQLHCVLTFNNKLDIPVLQRAVEISLIVEPVLGCRFVEQKNRAWWEYREDIGQGNCFQLIESAETSDALSEFICTPADPCTDPLIQVRLYRNQIDTLCIKVNHVVADATGCKQYLYLLADLYRRLSQDINFSPASKPRTKRNERILFRHVGLRALLHAYRNRLSPTPTWGLPRSSMDFSGTNYAVMRLPSARFRMLIEYAHLHHVTVNDIVLTAFYRALFEILNPPYNSPLPISVPVDMRRYLSRDYSLPICNFSSSMFPVLERATNEGFEQTLARLHRTMDSLKKHHPGLNSAVYQAWIFLRGYESAKQRIQNMQALGMQYGTFYPMLTNFGVIDHRLLNFSSSSPTDAYMVSPLFYPPGFMVGVNTFRDTFTVIAGFCHTATDRKSIRRFMEQLDHELPGDGLLAGITEEKPLT